MLITMLNLLLNVVKVNKKSTTDAAARRCFSKKMFLKISQNSQENTCARISFFNKVARGTGVFQ